MKCLGFLGGFDMLGLDLFNEVRNTFCIAAFASHTGLAAVFGFSFVNISKQPVRTDT